MSVCTIVAYQFEILVEHVAEDTPPIILEIIGEHNHIELIRQDYEILKDTIVNFREPF
jgi:hypothetical protein